MNMRKASGRGFTIVQRSLLDYLDRYNGQRPHQGLNSRTPYRILAQRLQHLPHTWWASQLIDLISGTEYFARLLLPRATTSTGKPNETDFPAKQPQTSAFTRVSCADAHARGESDHQCPPQKGTDPSHALTRERKFRLPSFVFRTGWRQSQYMHDFKASFGWGRRLHGTVAFETVFSDRKHPPVRTPVFTIYRCENGRSHPRLGMAISRRAARKAIRRNRIKRQIRETFRQQRGLPSMDFVVTCAERVNAKVPPPEMTALLRQIWQNLACSKDRPRNRHG